MGKGKGGEGKGSNEPPLKILDPPLVPVSADKPFHYSCNYLNNSFFRDISIFLSMFCFHLGRERQATANCTFKSLCMLQSSAVWDGKDLEHSADFGYEAIVPVYAQVNRSHPKVATDKFYHSNLNLTYNKSHNNENLQ